MSDYGIGRNFNPTQREALEANGNVLVSASAGSGKTTVVVAKILKIIAEGGDIRRMAIMTFSRAAAAEMKNRITRELYNLSRRVPDWHIAEQLDAFPFSNICTIDSFCLGLIKKYFAAVGADPSAKPLDAEESELMLNDSIDSACEELLEREDENFISLCERFAVGRNLDRVKDLIKSLRDYLVTRPDSDSFTETDFDAPTEQYLLKELVRSANGFLARDSFVPQALAEAGMTEEGEKYVLMRSVCLELFGAKDLESAFSAVLYAPDVSKCLKKKAIYVTGRDYFNEAVDAYKKIVGTAREFREAYYDSKANDSGKSDAEGLLNATLLAERIYSEAKRRENRLDFSDMGAIALRILENDKIREEVKNSFDYVFVDEYQDTNYLQEKLIEAVSRDNVYAVGDVKQAIYHFRYAEPKIFKARMKRNMSGAGATVRLNKNYRSRAEILEFVNRVCSQVMTEDFCDIDYRNNDIMDAGAEFAGGDSAVEIHLAEDDNKDRPVGVYSVRDAVIEDGDDAEAELAARLIADTVKNGVIYRPKEKREDRVKFSDIAVLTRKNKEGNKIAAALERIGIPYSVAEASDDRFAPRELLADFIRLTVSYPDAAVINAMLCPLFSFTPTELINIRKRSPKTTFWGAVKAFNEPGELYERTRKFIDYIEKIALEATVYKVSDIFVKVLSDGLDGYFLSLGGDVSGRIYKFLTTVRGLDSDKNPCDFLKWYDASYKGEKPPAKRDSVTIMTMHRSKGLEFPVVVLPYCNSTSAPDGKKTLYTDGELGIALKSVDEDEGRTTDNFRTKVLKLKNANDEREELARLMYVSFTRARNKLIITGRRTREIGDLRSARSMMDFLFYAAGRDPFVKHLIPETDEGREAKEIISAEIHEKSADFSYLKGEYAFEKATVQPLKTSVTELLHEEEEEERGVFKPYGRTRSATAAEGTAYHLVLQKIDFAVTEPADIGAFIAALRDSGEIEPEIAASLLPEKIAEILNCDIMTRARNAKCLREVPFVNCVETEQGETLVQGVVDLIIFEDDGMIIVDYKASGLGKEELKNRYFRQLELYAQAAEKIFKLPTKGKYLLNILANYVVEV